MENELKRLIEQRTAEARKKDISDKSLRILKSFGTDIIKHIAEESIPDMWEWELGSEQDETEINTEDSASSYAVGKYLDMLTTGTNMQIKNDIRDSELKITYHGHIVYQEIGGEIKRYVPMKEWESVIDRFFENAKKKEIKRKKEKKIEEKEKWEKTGRSKLRDYLLKFWGFKA